MKKYVLILLVFLFSYSHNVFADDSDLFMTGAKPNVLIILDNSNSMDEDFYGNAVGSFASSSKSVVGKSRLRDIIDSFKTKLRVGLMTYKIPEVLSLHLHNATYFASYDPNSYCPNPPPECVTYAQTGDGTARGKCESACVKDNPGFKVDYFDEIITNYPLKSEQRNRYSNLIFPHTQRWKNPTDPSGFIYFKGAHPYYFQLDEGKAFCYGTGYSPNEDTKDHYDCYRTKVGPADDGSGYSNPCYGRNIAPTDSDFALGFHDFGKRLYLYHVGQSWFADGSPGNGYLHVSVDDLVKHDGNPSDTYNKIRKKLDPKEGDETEYMKCNNVDKNTCNYVLNAGLTPTAGTLGEATKYFKGQGGYTSPIDYWCQNNFIIYVTDGLPSVDESGKADTADHLMPTVLTKIDALRTLIRNAKGKDGKNEDLTFDIKTYILGVGLSDEAKLRLDEMAVRGGTDVSGRAYYADKPDQLEKALDQIFTSVLESAYSFASPTVPSVRMIDKDILYLSSFTPLDKSPFWPGSLKAYQLDPDGTLPVDKNTKLPSNAPIWVASIPASERRSMKTYTPSGLVEFDSKNKNITIEDLGVAADEDRLALISYIRNLPLGDIIHSNSVIVGSPSQFFEDEGFNGTGGFYEKNKERTKVIIVGANDGMLHAFDAATGVEQWAFIPNSVLKNLKLMKANHTFYVDSTPKVADVWLDYNGDNRKITDEWRTVLVCGLRNGGKTYFALDITNTRDPKYLWEFPKTTDATTLSLVGQSWSEPAIGRVKIEKAGGLVEGWVAFIGGGFDPYEKVDKDAEIGRAFFVVDIMTGEIIWQLSYDPGDAVKKWMKHSFPAAATAVDTNFDGYVDKVYIGDLGGQMWVFDVSFDESTKKSDSLWAGKSKRLFKAQGSNAEKHNIYYQPAVAFDMNGTPWVFFGTGDRADPQDKDSKNQRERFYAVKDDGLGNYPRDENDLANLIESGKNNFKPVSEKGWFIRLEKVEKKLEKVLARPAVFNRLVYFTTYTPETTALCAASGVGKEYVVEFLSGGGALAVDELSDLSGPAGARSREIGEHSGAPSAPVITVNRKGKASVTIGTTSGQISSGEAFSLTTNREILFWREVVP